MFVSDPFTFIIHTLELFFQMLGIIVLVSSGIHFFFRFILEQAFRISVQKGKALEHLRVAFAQRIVFSLEFFIVADVLATVLRPEISEILQLGLIILVRTLLSFFITKELSTLPERGEHE